MNNERITKREILERIRKIRKELPEGVLLDEILDLEISILMDYREETK